MKHWIYFFIPLLATGCSQTFKDPLLDAPTGQRIACSSVKAIQSQDSLSSVPLNCPELNVSASLNELRDAGWRLENIHLGEDIKVNDTLATEVDVIVRKIY